MFALITSTHFRAWVLWGGGVFHTYHTGPNVRKMNLFSPETWPPSTPVDLEWQNPEVATVASVIGEFAVTKLKLPLLASWFPFPVEFPEFLPDELFCPLLLVVPDKFLTKTSFECLESAFLIKLTLTLPLNLLLWSPSIAAETTIVPPEATVLFGHAGISSTLRRGWIPPGQHKQGACTGNES